jgi:hypothetical protein
MSAVITRQPENRLAKSLWAPGGKTIAQALEDATSNIEAARLESLDVLRAKLAQIQTLSRAPPQGVSVADTRILYGLSNEVLDISGVYGLVELGQAAYSLCELLDKLGERQVWNWPAVEVHLNGLLLLADPDNKAPPDARKSIVEGLSQVRRHVAGHKRPEAS